jgi:hypothetical protein
MDLNFILFLLVSYTRTHGSWNHDYNLHLELIRGGGANRATIYIYIYIGKIKMV